MKAGYVHYHNKSCCSTLGQVWSDWHDTSELQKGHTADAAMCFCIDNVLWRWTPRYLTDILKGTLFPPMFAHSLSTNSRQDAVPTGITSVLSVFNNSNTNGPLLQFLLCSPGQFTMKSNTHMDCICNNIIQNTNTSTRIYRYISMFLANLHMGLD